MSVVPIPGVCLKTRLHVARAGNDGGTAAPAPAPKAKRVFINLCHSPEVDAAHVELTEEGHGHDSHSHGHSHGHGHGHTHVNGRWALPYILGPMRHEQTASGKECLVFDIVFASETLAQSVHNDKIRLLLIQTAFECTERQFDVSLSRKYKQDIGSNFKGRTAALVSEVATPRYRVVHRTDALRQAEAAAAGGAASTRPDELVLKVELPLMEGVGTPVPLQLDIAAERVELRAGGLYYLALPLPYAVVPERGRAQFHVTARLLEIVLPLHPTATALLRQPQAAAAAAEVVPRVPGEEEAAVVAAASSVLPYRGLVSHVLRGGGGGAGGGGGGELAWRCRQSVAAVVLVVTLPAVGGSGEGNEDPAAATPAAACEFASTSVALTTATARLRLAPLWAEVAPERCHWSLTSAGAVLVLAKCQAQLWPRLLQQQQQQQEGASRATG